jgi:hypothetical protein
MHTRIMRHACRICGYHGVSRVHYDHLKYLKTAAAVADVSELFPSHCANGSVVGAVNRATVPHCELVLQKSHPPSDSNMAQDR